MILNAADLSDVTTACYYRPDGLVAQGLQTFYDGTTKALYLRTIQGTKFSDIHTIYFSGTNGVNMCASNTSHTFYYNIEGG